MQATGRSTIIIITALWCWFCLCYWKFFFAIPSSYTKACSISFELLLATVMQLEIVMKQIQGKIYYCSRKNQSFKSKRDADCEFCLYSSSLQLVRQGVFLLVNLFLNDRLLVDHRYRVEVEHQYVHLLCGVTRLYKRIPDILSEIEGVFLGIY